MIFELNRALWCTNPPCVYRLHSIIVVYTTPYGLHEDTQSYRYATSTATKSFLIAEDQRPDTTTPQFSNAFCLLHFGCSTSVSVGVGKASIPTSYIVYIYDVVIHHRHSSPLLHIICPAFLRIMWSHVPHLAIRQRLWRELAWICALYKFCNNNNNNNNDE